MCFGEGRHDRERPAIACFRLLQSPQVAQDDTEVAMGRRERWHELQRANVTRRRFFQPSQLPEQASQVAVHRNLVRLDLQRPTVTRLRFVWPPQVHEHVAQDPVRIRVARRQRDRLLQGHQGAGGLAPLRERGAQHCPTKIEQRETCRHRPGEGFRLRMPALAEEAQQRMGLLRVRGPGDSRGASVGRHFSRDRVEVRLDSTQARAHDGRGNLLQWGGNEHVAA